MLLEPMRMSLSSWAVAGWARNSIPQSARAALLTMIIPRPPFLFTGLLMQGVENFLRGNRQIHNPHAHRIVDRVSDGRRHLRNSAFPDFFALKRRRAGVAMHQRRLER